MMFRYLILSCCLMCFGSPLLKAQHITTFTASDKEVLAGQPFDVEITVSYPQGSQSLIVNFEHAKKTGNELYRKDSTLFEAFADIELLENSTWKDFSCQHDFRLNLDPDPLVQSITNICTFAIYNPGIFILKPPAINGTVNDSLALKIEVVVPEIDSLTHLKDKDIYPIKPIEIEPDHWSDYAIWFYVLLGIIFIYIIWKKYKTRKNLQEVVVDKENTPSPADTALEKLKGLENSLSANAVDMLQFHEKISYIIREYLEKQMAIPALELASAETIDQFESHQTHENFLVEKLGRILNYADLVKFAKSKSEMELACFLLEEATDLVRKTSGT